MIDHLALHRGKTRDSADVPRARTRLPEYGNDHHRCS